MARTHFRRPLPIPATIGLVFGGLWSSLGAAGLPREYRSGAEAAGFLITAVLIAVLWFGKGSGGPASMTSGAGPSLFRRPGYLIAVAAEIAAIIAVSILLPQHGLKAYVLPAVGVIVGLHFLGLWQAMRLAAFLWIAGGMVLASAASAALPEVAGALGPRMLMAGFGNALVLWVGAGWPARPA